MIWTTKVLKWTFKKFNQEVLWFLLKFAKAQNKRFYTYIFAYTQSKGRFLGFKVVGLVLCRPEQGLSTGRGLIKGFLGLFKFLTFLLSLYIQGYRGSLSWSDFQSQSNQKRDTILEKQKKLQNAQTSILPTAPHTYFQYQGFRLHPRFLKIS